MSGPLDFTNQNIENTYQRVLQTDGIDVYDGTGSLFVLPSANTSSLLTTASATGNTITFTKGDGSTFPLTVDTGSGGTTTPTSSLLVTASSTLNQITFTKGDASQFTITVDTGSGTNIDTGSFVTTSSFNNFTSSYNTGSFTGSFTGIFNGTASWANSASQAISASYALSSSYALSASYSITASYALNGGVTQILAGPNISLSPTNGLGQVTISSTGGGGGGFNTATGSYGSFYDTTIQTNPIANIARSMSFNSTDITNGVSISGSTSPFNTYIKTENAGIYNIQFSAQIDKTDSGTDVIDIWLRKNGIDLIDTATKLTLTGNNTKVVAAWNWFVSSATNDYYQIIWSSADTNMRLFAEPASGIHPGIPSVILTVNRIDQFLSNTGSFTGSFTGQLIGTSSWATNALTSSFVTASNVYGPFGSNSILSASYASQSLSSSYSLSSSFTQTASYYQETDPVFVAKSASLATTGSNIFIGNQTISGSIFISGSTQGGGSGHILTYNTSSGEVFFTASSAIGGAGGNSIGELTGDVIAGPSTTSSESVISILKTNLKVGSFGVTVDGVTTVIQVGQVGYVEMPYDGTIIGWSITANVSGSIVFDVWKATAVIPTVANTIIGTGTKPSLSSTQINISTPTGWTTVSFNAGDIIGFYVDSATTIKRATLTLRTNKI